MRAGVISILSAAIFLGAVSLALAGNAGTRSSQSSMCMQLVAAKHLKTHDEKSAEYQKCRTDPSNYK
jgi:hypothetical protein